MKLLKMLVVTLISRSTLMLPYSFNLFNYKEIAGFLESNQRY